ncbi:death domain-containing protein CRADD [Alosa sapidissima]|uniref:death domain-containing protein CRADD n=1 Tax=Alosa sapidissima TaxID=34773 RepID=UPI001C08E8BA|nr:death domain-containing protein CRADD [Alosa sapidissima]
MEPQHKYILRKHRLDLSSNISTDDTIVQYLYQEDILTLDHVEEIQAQSSSKKRTLMLLDILPGRGPKAFGTFLEALEVEYPWVQEKLLQRLDNNAVQITGTDHWAVSESVLQSVPSERQLNRLAGRLGPEWESVLLDLGLSAEDVYRCRANHPLAVQSQVLAGLVLWKQRIGRRATVQALVQSLQAAELHPSVLDQVFL